MQGLLGKHIVIYLQNANETLLQHRMKNILRNNISSQVAWRPFHIQSFRYQGCTVRKVLNIFYTLFIFLLIIFGYTSSIIACQARLDIKHKVLAFLFFKVELFILWLFLAQWPELTWGCIISTALMSSFLDLIFIPGEWKKRGPGNELTYQSPV